jgi:hypothetical protein
MKNGALFLLLVALMNLAWGSPVGMGEINPDLLTKAWAATWIAPQGVSLTDFGVYHFRRTFDLETVPRKFVVHVSADNRYQLFVNGTPVARGPSRGDLRNWRYESVDIADYLVSGSNSLGAVVWNFGEHVPWAQVSRRTGFILQGNGPKESLVNTNKKWRVLTNPSITPIPPQGLNTFIVVGPGEKLDANLYPWGWQETSYGDAEWQTPRIMTTGIPRGVGTDLDRMLVPRTIPPMEETPQRLGRVVRSTGVQVGREFLQGRHPITVPPRTEAKILLDQAHLTTAYPILTVSQGKRSEITLTYAEALFDANGEKGHRDAS